MAGRSNPPKSAGPPPPPKSVYIVHAPTVDAGERAVSLMSPRDRPSRHAILHLSSDTIMRACPALWKDWGGDIVQAALYRSPPGQACNQYSSSYCLQRVLEGVLTGLFPNVVPVRDGEDSSDTPPPEVLVPNAPQSDVPNAPESGVPNAPESGVPNAPESGVPSIPYHKVYTVFEITRDDIEVNGSNSHIRYIYSDDRIKNLNDVHKQSQECRELMNKAMGHIQTSTDPPTDPPTDLHASLFPSVHFLGTGAAIPGKYRNVTGICVEIRRDYRILLDCGEGVLSMWRLSCPTMEDFIDRLTTLRVIYISHGHADHHVGLHSILKARYELCDRKELKNLLIIGPQYLQEWISYWDDICFRTTLTACEDTLVNPLALTDDLSISLCRVEHTYRMTAAGRISQGCFGARIKGSCIDLVYSGDTGPSSDLIKLGHGCDVLIHEATFEDILESEAVAKCHSTLTHALDASRQMGAKHTILSHFSQRYPTVPDLTNASDTIVAFDNLRIPLSLLGPPLSRAMICPLPTILGTVRGAGDEE
eukprot:GHVO01012986.1.p1 GENE.GHVO01012986.1~~GHVO01012986.1.p1  ORF type:complete len:534 (-),score=124.58 GHVO01012986.1:139-1740(-)